MAEHHAKDVSSPTLAVGLNYGNARAEIDLDFLAGFAFHAPKGQRLVVAQVPDKAASAGILGGETVLSYQVLEDALRRQPELELVENDLPPRFAATGLPTGPKFWRAEPMGASWGVACFEPMGAPSGVACFELWRLPLGWPVLLRRSGQGRPGAPRPDLAALHWLGYAARQYHD